MTNDRNRASARGGSPVMDFIKKYWLLFVVGLLGIPYLYRYYVASQAKDNEAVTEAQEKNMANQMQNPSTQQDALNKITTRLDLQDIARNVAYNLGTSFQVKNASWYSFLNPRGWSENDEKAYNQLKLINYASSRDLVVKCYYLMTRRNLLDDVKTLLDEEYKKKLPLFK